MDIQEIKKIELTKEETEKLIRRGLGISEGSDVKFSIKIPEKVKLTITTVILEKEINTNKLIRTATDVKLTPLDGVPGVDSVVLKDSSGGKTCNNCSYPYSTDSGLFCSMENKNVKDNFSCSTFAPEIKEKTASYADLT